MSFAPEQEERLLLAQQRSGYRNLRFIDELERPFARHRMQRIRRRLLLIASAAGGFQLVYTLLDFILLPRPVAWSVLPLRLLALISVLSVYWYCRRPQSPPGPAQLAYAAAYGLNGACVAMIIHVCWSQGVPMPYEGLFLILLFGYVLLGLSFRAASSSGWAFCGLFLLLGLLLTDAGASLGYQGLFLGCANLIGSVGAYIQEHGQRGAWLNLRLLDLARQRAEADDARKLRLLAAASHDLRQPLNAMGLYAQHLLERVSEPHTRQISARLATSVEQLGRLLQSLLDYTRLTLPGGVQAKPEPLALWPLLTRLLAEARAEEGVTGTDLQLRCLGEQWVCSDPVLLERLLRNLLNNALRHAQARHVWLHAEKDGEQIRIEVGDDGRGLSEDEQKQVFEEFRQLNNPGRNSELGLGLGLAIVQQLAGLLGHRLRLLSSPGQGARFQLWLPATAAGPLSPRAVASQVLSGRVLLLEDDAAGREALQGLLKRWGCEVWACADLEQALACLAEAEPQLLISDYRLAAEEDGLRAIERLREMAGSMLPAVLISADISPELHERCIPAHITLLAKPLLPARLRQALAVLVRASPAVEPS